MKALRLEQKLFGNVTSVVHASSNTLLLPNRGSSSTGCKLQTSIAFTANDLHPSLLLEVGLLRHVVPIGAEFPQKMISLIR